MFKQYRSDPLTEREKAYLRRVKGIVQPHSAAVGPKPSDKPNNEREYLAPVKVGFRPAKRGSGCRMSASVRAMVEQRNEARRAFFAELGVRV